MSFISTTWESRVKPAKTQVSLMRGDTSSQKSQVSPVAYFKITLDGNDPDNLGTLQTLNINVPQIQ